jgi:hypothetical protein
MGNLNIQTKHVDQVVCFFMIIAAPVNIVKSFRTIGIRGVIDDRELLCSIGLTWAQYFLYPMAGVVPRYNATTKDDDFDAKMLV